MGSSQLSLNHAFSPFASVAPDGYVTGYRSTNFVTDAPLSTASFNWPSSVTVLPEGVPSICPRQNVPSSSSTLIVSSSLRLVIESTVSVVAYCADAAVVVVETGASTRICCNSVRHTRARSHSSIAESRIALVTRSSGAIGTSGITQFITDGEYAVGAWTTMVMIYPARLLII